jgi:hypothetical protein
MSGSSYKRKTWREKLFVSHGLPKVSPIVGSMSRRWGEGTVAIPAPIEVDELMKKVSKGKLTTINDLRAAIARKHCATIGCPITTGIFVNIAANVAEEDLLEGKKRVTPYWRTLKVNGELNPKYPGGVNRQRQRLKAEGHKVVQRGKRFFVEDFESKLAKLS